MILNKSPKIHSFNSNLKQLNTQVIQSDSVLLKGVIESFLDGILLVTEQGEWVQANTQARQICEQLTPNQSQPNSLPKEIWDVCQALIESRSWYPEQPVIIDSEITTSKSTTLRIRARWLNLDTISSPCILVILENQDHSLQSLIPEVDKYGLTPRETEVWLRRKANYTCKEIAAELYISINTVKKHMKNIRAKQASTLYRQEWQLRLPLNPNSFLN